MHSTDVCQELHVQAEQTFNENKKHFQLLWRNPEPVFDYSSPWDTSVKINVSS